MRTKKTWILQQTQTYFAAENGLMAMSKDLGKRAKFLVRTGLYADKYHKGRVQVGWPKAFERCGMSRLFSRRPGPAIMPNTF